MERDSVSSRIKRGFYPLMLSTVVGFSSIACGFGQTQSFLPDMSLAPTPTTLEPDLQRFINNNPSFKKVYEKARGKNYGVVLFSPENLSSDTWVRFQRVDIADTERTELDLETVKLTPQQAEEGSQIFLATACNGEYQLSMSFDGNNYTNLSLPDLNTGAARETFFLRPSCMRPVTVSFEKPDHT